MENNAQSPLRPIPDLDSTGRVRSGASTRISGLAGPVVTFAVAGCVLTWVVWLIAHAPGIRTTADREGLLLMGLLAAPAFGAGAVAGGVLRGGMAGVMTALLTAGINLVLLAAVLVDGVEEAERRGAEPPALAGLIGLYLAQSAGIGLAGGLIGGVAGVRRGSGPIARFADADLRDWLGRFSVVAAGSFVPLLAVGGLVTSYVAGMAVPDWPGTYGRSMVLFALSRMESDPKIFLEHSHRLLGAMVGLICLMQMVMVLAIDPRRWVKGWAVGLFVLVGVQGLLGGVRVTENKQLYAAFHGVTAQFVFAAAVALAVCLSRACRTDLPIPASDGLDRKRAALATGLLHLLFVQLVFGALYRHLGSAHVLYTHIAVSLAVVAMGVIAPARASRRSADGPTARLMRRAAKAVVVLVCVQFSLGWLALAAAPPGPRTIPTAEQLADAPAVEAWRAWSRTAHQTNGALLLAAATVMTVAARHLRTRHHVARQEAAIESLPGVPCDARPDGRPERSGTAAGVGSGL